MSERNLNILIYVIYLSLVYYIFCQFYLLSGHAPKNQVRQWKSCENPLTMAPPRLFVGVTCLWQLNRGENLHEILHGGVQLNFAVTFRFMLKSGQEWRTPYQKTCARFCSHQLATYLRKRRIFRSKPPLRTVRPIYRTGVPLPSRCCILYTFFFNKYKYRVF